MADQKAETGERSDHELTPSLRNTFPGLRDAQSAYLGAIDSLTAPDRRTQELIRLASSVILRHPLGVERHAMLAAEFGATWEDVVGTLVLTQPGWGLVPALEAMQYARSGFEQGRAAAAADDDDPEV